MAEVKTTPANAGVKPNTAAPKTSSKGAEKNASKKETDRNGTPVVAFTDLKKHDDNIPGIAAPDAGK